MLWKGNTGNINPDFAVFLFRVSKVDVVYLIVGRSDSSS